MYQSNWFIIVGIATIMTLAWMFVDARTPMTAGLSFISWGLAALQSGNLTKMLDDGTTADVSAIPQFRYFLLAMALLSLLTLILYQVGVYPPEGTETQPTDAKQPAPE